MIKAVIFDMDGLLIDSEPLWHIAEIEISNKVGINLTKEECLETTGLKTEKIIEYWYHNKKSWDNFSLEDVKNMLIEKLILLVKEIGKEFPGAEFALVFIKKKNIKIALASSSSMNIINTVIDKLEIKNYFDEIYSAEFEEHGKPHPGVYLTTAKVLDVRPEECLAIEDSLNGMLAAKSARMKCLAVPDESITGNPRFAIVDEILPSLEFFNDEVWNKLN